MTLKSWIEQSTATTRKLAETLFTWCVLWPMTLICWAVVVVLGSIAFVAWLLPDFLPRRGLKQSTSQAPQKRKLAIPVREGSDIFVLNPDGSKVALDALEAKVQAQAWFEVVSGAMVFEKTKLP